MRKNKILLGILVGGLFALFITSGKTNPVSEKIPFVSEENSCFFLPSREAVLLQLEEIEKEEKISGPSPEELESVKAQLKDILAKWDQPLVSLYDVENLNLSPEEKDKLRLFLEKAEKNLCAKSLLIATKPQNDKTTKISSPSSEVDFFLLRFNPGPSATIYYRGYLVESGEQVENVEDYVFQIYGARGIEADWADEKTIVVEYFGGGLRTYDWKNIEDDWVELKKPDLQYTVRLIDCSDPDFDCKPTDW